MKAFVNRKVFFSFKSALKGKRKRIQRKRRNSILAGRVSEEGISKFICFWLFVNSVARVENLENWVVMMPETRVPPRLSFQVPCECVCAHGS